MLSSNWKLLHEYAAMLLDATDYFTETCSKHAIKTLFIISSAPVVRAVDEEQ